MAEGQGSRGTQNRNTQNLLSSRFGTGRNLCHIMAKQVTRPVQIQTGEINPIFWWEDGKVMWQMDLDTRRGAMVTPFTDNLPQEVQKALSAAQEESPSGNLLAPLPLTDFRTKWVPLFKMPFTPTVLCVCWVPQNLLPVSSTSPLYVVISKFHFCIPNRKALSTTLRNSIFSCITKYLANGVGFINDQMRLLSQG